MARTLTAIFENGMVTTRKTERSYSAAWIIIGRKTAEAPVQVIYHGFTRDPSLAQKAVRTAGGCCPSGEPRWFNLLSRHPWKFEYAPYLDVERYVTTTITEHVSKPRTPKQEG